MKWIKEFETFLNNIKRIETEEERIERVQKERQEKLNEIFKNKNHDTIQTTRRKSR